MRATCSPWNRHMPSSSAVGYRSLGALASARRTTGLAMIATCIGIGKLASSVLFGWAWQTYGAKTSLALFAGALPIVLVASAIVMRRW